MSLKYGRSVLFDRPDKTKAKLQLQTVVNGFKQKLNINARSVSREMKGGAQKLTLTQAKYIETLHQKLKTVSFHTLYNSYQNYYTLAHEPSSSSINPQRIAQFRQGKYYRCSQRPQTAPKPRDRHNKELMEYYNRQPEEQIELNKKTIVFSDTINTRMRRSLTAKVR